MPLPILKQTSWTVMSLRGLGSLLSSSPYIEGEGKAASQRHLILTSCVSDLVISNPKFKFTWKMKALAQVFFVPE